MQALYNVSKLIELEYALLKCLKGQQQWKHANPKYEPILNHQVCHKPGQNLMVIMKVKYVCIIGNWKMRRTAIFYVWRHTA